ncbi:hypothetical protein COCCADRAFT_24738 [Bipolaris zeicola 26-R-13]|uniref:Peptidase S54 rhomboid domain-containing protein n=1 Tax=Cochliobolus carbonum (strain 26-R-13) TaxID=930089 RepID=W6YI55_COCC2|nr:uncharacterized protein COCCADRAFT_24738 [Bipolaris zeicola 26-R-13]EUC35334.1 hypothetical protein COCCADRAFT_24738 [Bipolaris zeicola 26-R-13]
MSSLLRLSSALRSLRTPTTKPPTFFSPSRPPPSLSLPRSRHYSYRNPTSSQVSANNKVLYGLMGTNIAVFSYAMYLQQQAAQGFPGPWHRFLRTFTLNFSEFKNGNYTPVLLANFTHIHVWHLFSNMLSFYFLGQFLASAAPLITPARFLTIAFGSGLSGSLGYLLSRYYKMRDLSPRARDTVRGMGFSGVVMGVSSVAACLAPHAKMLVYGIVPVPLWGLVAGYAVYDGYFVNSANTTIAHGGHLGGLAFGLLYYFAKLRGVRF